MMRHRAGWALALIMLAITSCGAQQPSPGPSSPSPSTYDVSTWRPTTPWTAPAVTDEELRSRRAAFLEQEARGLGLVPTPADPGLVRYIQAEETGAVYVKCLSDKGWTNKTPNPGGNGMQGSDPPESQKPAYHLALWQCYAMYTIDQTFMGGAASPALLRVLYEYTRDFLIPCIHSIGLQEREPLPSEEAFIASSGGWGGYPEASGEQAVTLHTTCPQVPPTQALKGR